MPMPVAATTCRFSGGLQLFDRKRHRSGVGPAQATPRDNGPGNAPRLRRAGHPQGHHGPGLRIPDDISVVALLDEDVAGMTTPPLTALSFKSKELGFKAVDMLIAQLNGDSSEQQQVLVPSTLHVRGGTGPACASQSPRYCADEGSGVMKPLGLGVLGLGEGRGVPFRPAYTATCGASSVCAI